MIKVVVTGASGFIGKHFLDINEAKYQCAPFSLRTNGLNSLNLNQVDCILHLAGIAHQKNITAIETYREINTQLPINLANKAKKAGVKHFIFMSSVKVYGDSFSKDILDINSLPKPTDAYGISKLEAEEELMRLDDDLFTVSIVRTPVVYGPEVKGNMLTLMKFVKQGRTLPLKNIANKRSMVYIGNLISMLNKIIDFKANGIFIAGDDRAISTSELIEYISKGLGVKQSNFKLPGLLRKLIKMLRPGFYNRVFESFEILNKESLDKLKISTQIPTAEGIAIMADWYKHNKQ